MIEDGTLFTFVWAAVLFLAIPWIYSKLAGPDDGLDKGRMG